MWCSLTSQGECYGRHKMFPGQWRIHTNTYTSRASVSDGGGGAALTPHSSVFPHSWLLLLLLLLEEDDKRRIFIDLLFFCFPISPFD